MAVSIREWELADEMGVSGEWELAGGKWGVSRRKWELAEGIGVSRRR